MKAKDIQLWIHNNYENIRFWASIVVLIIVAIALISFAQKMLNLANTIKDSGERNSRYLECVAKVFIAPPVKIKNIKGNVDDPGTALDNCRLTTNRTSNTLVVTSTHTPSLSPPQSSSQATQKPNSSATNTNTNSPTSTPKPSPSSTPPPTPPGGTDENPTPAERVIDILGNGVEAVGKVIKMITPL